MIDQSKRSPRALAALLAALLLVLGSCRDEIPPAESRPRPADPIGSETRIAPDLTALHLTDRTWVVVHEQPFPANSLVAEMDDGTLLLVDTPYHERATRALVAWLRTGFGPRPLVVVNTHFHPDALGGNRVFLEAGVPVWGSTATARLLHERGAGVRTALAAMAKDADTRDAILASSWRAPDHLVPDGESRTLRFGRDTALLHDPGPGHAPDNIVVVLPRHRTLFGGCLVRAGETLGNLDAADPTHWPDAIRSLLDFDVDHVVPGHGSRFDPGLLEHTLSLFPVPERTGRGG